jgi:hypothetical protein
MIRAALYARYSSDQQSASSIEDQFRICREHTSVRAGMRKSRFTEEQIIGILREHEAGSKAGELSPLRATINTVIIASLRHRILILLAAQLSPKLSRYMRLRSTTASSNKTRSAFHRKRNGTMHRIGQYLLCLLHHATMEKALSNNSGNMTVVITGQPAFPAGVSSNN